MHLPGLTNSWGHGCCMSGGGEVTTFEQLQAVTPRERHEHFLASIMCNDADLRPNERALLERSAELVQEREQRFRGEAS